MKTLCVLQVVLVLVLVCVALAQEDLRGLPVDVVHVLDRSGSVNKGDWRYFLEAAQNVTETIAAGTGYYRSESQNGLRATVITFVCLQNLDDTRGTRVHLNQSGSPEEIAETFKFLRSKGPIGPGRTCLRVAAQKVLSIADPNRLLAVILYSDGMVQDKSNVKGFAKAVENLNGIAFGVGTGRSMSKDGVKFLGNIVGSADRLFQYQNKQTMNRLAVGIRTHVSSTDISPIGVEVSPAGGGGLEDPETCIDEPLTVRLSNVPALLNLTNPECVFFEGEERLGSTLATVNNETLECDYIFNNIDSVSVGLILRDGDQVIADVTVPISRKFCFDFAYRIKGSGREFLPLSENPLQGCVAVEQTVTLRGGGPSLAVLRQSVNFSSFDCAITKNGQVLWQMPAVVQPSQDSFLCEITSSLLRGKSC